MKTEDLALFHRIAETGSLIEAADLLNLPKSTVSRRLQALEDELNIKLFHRQSRSMTLTSAGSHFYQRSQNILAQLDETLFEMTNEDAEISGHLRIQMFPIHSMNVLMQAIFRFMDLHPKLTVEVISSAESVDMVKNNLDVAFVVEPALDTLDLVVRPIFTTDLRFYASPQYLVQHGMPQTPQEIESHNVALFRLSNGKIFNELWIGAEQEVRVRGNFCSNSVEVAVEFALQGRGIVYAPAEVVADFVASGQLITLLPEIESHPGECYLAYPSRRYVSLASRRFIDFIIKELAPNGVPTNLSTQSVRRVCKASEEPFPPNDVRFSLKSTA
ncbi:LysR family transcriptional regulator [Shewanella xiamenensis]|uniref:LysR family transcriptional regulator n=1 Tax=Shewanella xiamenensis TaxID=332186 RepID=UPI00118540B6|nr:LysR family transcriptional regulator [Shewanella xiamenensis]TVL13803.1 LysR family transcriptional regulator [Shewanella xiamenensis]TVL13840.1 LysR family transcriptional regulator [Shewanella xiamenensis]TVL21491.1 LysR family transcriptional regulator [Shewanella xiamenensis]TVL27729.1 LysR family transcriptional regulator [Shewanella xiamenensis]TVO96651.1 LysR family transcriptional regulator [Shewanella xiamenensis]